MSRDYKKKGGDTLSGDIFLKKFFGLLIISTLFTVPLIFTTKTIDDTFLIKQVGLREFAVIFLAALLISRFSTRSRFEFNGIFFPFILFLSYALVSLFWCYNRYDGLLTIYDFVAGFTLFFSANIFMRRVKDLEKIVLLLLLVTVSVSLFGIFQKAGYNFFLSNPLNDAISPIGHPNISAQFLSLAFPVFVFMLLITLSNLKRILYAIAVFIVIAFLIMTECRGAWIGIIISLSISCMYVIFKRRDVLRIFTRRDKILIFVLILILILLIVIVIIKFSVMERMSKIFQFKEGGSGFRYYLWHGTLKMIRANPLFGVGIGNFQHNYPLFRDPREIELSGGATYIYNAENDLLQVLAETGFIGLFLFLSILIVIFRECYKKLRTIYDPRSFMIRIGIAAGIISCLVHSMFSFNLRNPASSALFWIFCGMLTSKGFSACKNIPSDLIKNTPKTSIVFKKLVYGVLIAIFFITATYKILLPLAGDYYFKKARAESSRGYIEESLISMEKSCSMYPYNFEAWFNYAYLLQKMKRYNQSMDKIKRSINLHKYNPLSLNVLGVNYHSLGELEEAEKYYKKALELDPTLEMARKNLALLYKSSGKMDKAINEYRQAEENAPFDEGIKIDMGLMYYEMGNLDKAEDCLKKALNLRPCIMDCDCLVRIPIDKYKLLGSGIKIYFRVDARNKYNRQLRNWSDWGNIVISDIGKGDIKIENPPYGCRLSLDRESKELLLQLTPVKDAYKYTLQLKSKEKTVVFEIPVNASYHANALNTLGIVYEDRNEKQLAKDYFEKAIATCAGYLPPYKNLIIHYLYQEPSYQKVRDVFNEYKKRSSGADDMDYLLEDMEKLKYVDK
ncbi:tetratricopeptide repeat protein [bacterium]|nr:tetratricopeptide repeat protein [bacterium]